MGRRRCCGLSSGVAELLLLLVLVHGVYSGSLSISITEQRISFKCCQKITYPLPVQVGLVKFLLHKGHMRLKPLQKSMHRPSSILELTDLLILFGHLSFRNVTDEREVVLDAGEHVLG